MDRELEGEYRQYLQELLDTGSSPHRSKPDAVLFAFDPWRLSADVRSGTQDEAPLAECRATLRRCWRLAREAFLATILQQTVLPALLPLLGDNEQRLPGSPSGFVTRLNAAIREDADADGVDLIALDDWALRHGLDA